jgi:hypothetical protein
MTKIVPENIKNNNWGFPISYFFIPIVCENSFNANLYPLRYAKCKYIKSLVFLNFS